MSKGLSCPGAAKWKVIPTPDWEKDPWEKIVAFSVLHTLALDWALEDQRRSHLKMVPKPHPIYDVLAERYMEEWEPDHQTEETPG